MARRYVGIILGTLLLLALVPATSQAHVANIGTSLGIGKAPSGATNPGQKVIIFGRLKAAEQDCKEGQTVRLFRRRPGPDRQIGKDVTDADGEYGFVKRPGRDRRVYTRFEGAVETSYGHSHTCLASRSRNLFINVLG
jgi:hypothetical protein